MKEKSTTGTITKPDIRPRGHVVAYEGGDCWDLGDVFLGIVPFRVYDALVQGGVTGWTAGIDPADREIMDDLLAFAARNDAQPPSSSAGNGKPILEVQ